MTKSPTQRQEDLKMRYNALFRAAYFYAALFIAYKDHFTEAELAPFYTAADHYDTDPEGHKLSLSINEIIQWLDSHADLPLLQLAQLLKKESSD